MNLHILPDSKFSDRFYANLKELGLSERNRCVVRTGEATVKHVTHEIPFGELYSSRFDQLVGDTEQYERVYIHQYSPLMYRWVARNRFREVNWCVWGANIYNLPGIGRTFYEPLTWSGFTGKSWRKDFLYLLKVYVTAMPFKRRAYAKVNHVLTWMKSEFDYVKDTLALPVAKWQFFFYENQLPYEQLDAIRQEYKPSEEKKRLTLIVGNSGTDTNNHLDAMNEIGKLAVPADLIIPVSYGSPEYKSFLKINASIYRNGSIRFMDTFLAFDDYVNLLLDSDGLVMNHRRPQGYGNILMMMYLEKPVFLNPENISIPDLNANGLRWHRLEEIDKITVGDDRGNKESVMRTFSHQRLLDIYRKIFG